MIVLTHRFCSYPTAFLDFLPLPRRIVRHLGQAFEAQDRKALCNQFLYSELPSILLNTVLRNSDNTGLHLKLRCHAISSREAFQDEHCQQDLFLLHAVMGLPSVPIIGPYACAAVNNLSSSKVSVSSPVKWKSCFFLTGSLEDKLRSIYTALKMMST